MPLVTLKELKAQLKPGRRLMAVDHAPKTLGLALAVPALGVVTPLKTLRRTKFTEDARALARIMQEYEVGGLILGLPLNMDGSSGPRADSVRHFAYNLIRAQELFPEALLIALQDERLSTHAAETDMIEDLDMSKEKRKDRIDAHAAAKILESALAAMNVI